MATWPSTLPQSLSMVLLRKRQSGRVRSEVDAGPAKQRARFTAVTMEYTAELTPITGAQLTIFNTFYTDTLGQGAASFTWIDPVTDVAATLRFKEDPQETLLAAHDDPDQRLYSVTMPLEQLP